MGQPSATYQAESLEVGADVLQRRLRREAADENLLGPRDHLLGCVGRERLLWLVSGEISRASTRNGAGVSARPEADAWAHSSTWKWKWPEELICRPLVLTLNVRFVYVFGQPNTSGNLLGRSPLGCPLVVSQV